MNESIILFLFYALIVIVLAFLIKRRHKTEHYDEMQLKNRAEAYKRENFWNLVLSKVSASAMMTVTFITLAVVIGIKQYRENKICED